jgi:CSLREA domain-containing protein
MAIRVSAAVLLAAALLFADAWWGDPSTGNAGLVLHITVTTTADEDSPGAPCSLREAIVTANTNTNYNGCFKGAFGDDTHISFNIGSGTPVINISSSLPTITDNTIIDGNTGGASFVELRGPGGTFAAGQHGLNISAPNSTVSNMIIRSFRDAGILASGANLTLVGNRIGTTADGTGTASNTGFGVHITGPDATIGGMKAGGSCSGECNLISGNQMGNVRLGNNSGSALVYGNFIGTDVTGTIALSAGPAVPGLLVEDSAIIGDPAGTTPGGPCTGRCNLISGMDTGIDIKPSGGNSRVESNFIGTDVSGTAKIPNRNGISSAANSTFIGGFAAGAGNLISGNDNTGLSFSGNTIAMGNRIGTDASGTSPLGNLFGIRASLSSSVAFIGGSAPGAGNIISGNTVGVELSATQDVRILGNLIGTAADGSTPLDNVIGIQILDGSVGNTIGGTEVGAANTIVNQQVGVLVFGDTTVRNTIRGNSIHSHSGSRKGIDNLNGGNTELPPPVITGLGSIHGTACPLCIIDVYSDDEDEGRIYEGATTADGSGNWTFNGSLDGPFVTATATDAAGNTSEFSAPFDPTPPTPTPSPTPSPTPPPTPTPTATPSGLTQGDVNCDNQVNQDDFFFLLQFAAEIIDGTTPGACPDLGSALPAGGIPDFWGDVNCDDAVNAVDALHVLAFPDIELPHPDCRDIGQSL